MKKNLKSLLLLALFATGIRAATNKTFFMPRPHGVNLAMEYTTWNELLQTKDEDRFGAHFQITGFYQDSTDEDELGRYFGIKNKHIINMAADAANNTTIDFDWRRIIPRPDTTDAGQSFTLQFDPEQTAYGVRIDYYQDLRKILKGLYFKTALPIVHVENDMQMKVYNKAGNLFTAGNTVENFFKGTLNATTNDPYKLANLQYAKIDGQKSSTGVADIDLVLGYKFLDKEKYHFSINIGLTIPTGDEADGVWLFEPIVGNGDHWAFGGGFDFGAKIWDDDNQNIKLAIALNYRFLFESTEKRTVGLKNFGGAGQGTAAQKANVHEFGHYRRLSNVVIPNGDLSGATTFPLPAANVLTTNVDVEPGSQLDAIIAFAYNNGGFTVDLGYNLFWKDDEDVNLKRDPLSGGNYAVMYEETDGDTGALTAADVVAGRVMTVADLDPGAAATPSQVTHKLYGGLGYIFKDWEYPLMLGIAGHYEFACDDGIENWGIWGKLGIAF